MNAERLRELAELLLQKEQQFPVQQNLQQLSNELSQLVGSPQERNFQVQYATTLEAFKKTMSQISNSFTPAQTKLLGEIGADKFFVDNLAHYVEKITQENPLTPAVIHQKLTDLIARRQTYLDNITELRNRLNALGIQVPKLATGTGEAGFLVPRDLFHNRFDEFIRELSVLNRIVRVFSEIAVGAPEQVEVHQISTSDPLLFLGLDPKTLALLGLVFTWALDRLKTIMEIRRIRSDALKNEIFSDKEIEEIFDSKISRTINKAIDEKVTEILGKPKTTPGRHHEQRTDLAWALESIFSRIERGMTLELRFIPPPTPKKAEGAAEAPPPPPEFEELKKIVRELVFPQIESNPVLKLPPSEPPEAEPEKPAPKKG